MMFMSTTTGAEPISLQALAPYRHYAPSWEQIFTLLSSTSLRALLEMTHTTLIRVLPEVTGLISRENDSVFSIRFPTFTVGSGDRRRPSQSCMLGFPLNIAARSLLFILHTCSKDLVLCHRADIDEAHQQKLWRETAKEHIKITQI